MEVHIIISFIIGLGFLIVGLRKRQTGNWFLNQGKVTKGKVTDVIMKRETGSNSYKQTYYYPVVYFETSDGQAVSQELDYGTTFNEYAKGKEVEIVYDPADPQKCQLNSRPVLVYTPWLFMAFGFILLTVGVLLQFELL